MSPAPTGNAAFDAARAAGVIDTFLALPSSREVQAKKYDYIRALTRDAETQRMEMPAEYMFKEVPAFEQVDDSVALTVALMDEHGIERMLVGVQDRRGRDALTRHPDRFAAMWNVDPNTGMEAVRALEAAVADHGVVAAHCWGTGTSPPVPIDDRRMYPLYAKCVELDIAMIVYIGVPGPRVPYDPLEVERLDEVCWFFPELRLVTRHGGEPWTALMVKLMLKWPNLYYSTSAFAPKYYPSDIVDYANTRGADRIVYAGYFSAGLGLDRIFAELPAVPFRDHVWPKFLRENAQRAFDL